MITTKQRAYLRGLAMNINPTMQIGKEGLKDESIKQIEDMLNASELVKIRVLNNCDDSIKDLANSVSKITNCDIVQVIGKTFVLYRRSTKKGVKHIEI